MGNAYWRMLHVTFRPSFLNHKLPNVIVLINEPQFGNFLIPAITMTGWGQRRLNTFFQSLQAWEPSQLLKLLKLLKLLNTLPPEQMPADLTNTQGRLKASEHDASE